MHEAQRNRGYRDEVVPSSLPTGISLFRMRITNQSTENGRPLGELNIQPEFIDAFRTQGIIMHEDINRYPGSRYGSSINIGAKEELVQNWQPLLDTLADVHRLYFAGVEGDPTLGNLDEMSEIIRAAPAYCLYRGENPYPDQGSLPVEIGLAYKASLGVRVITQAILRTQSPDTRITGQMLYQEAEQGGYLVESGEGCAGSPLRIIRVCDTLLTQTHGNPAQRRFEQAIEDFSKLRQFAPLYTQFRTKYKTFFDYAEATYEGMKGFTLLGMADTQLTELFASYYEKEASFLAEMNTLQSQINVALDRDPSQADQLTTEDIDLLPKKTPIVLLRP